MTSQCGFLILILRAEYLAIVPEESRGSKLRVEWSRVRQNVLDVADKHLRKGRDLTELLVSMDEFDEENLSEVSFRVMPHLLPVPPQKGKKTVKLTSKTVEEMFFCTAEEHTPIETFVKDAPTNQPLLFRCQSCLWIKVDSSAIQGKDVSCFADAVELLLATFYVFNVEYPYHLKPTYELLESLLKIRKQPSASWAKNLLRVINIAQ